tara:strand:- start:183 stop:386 length:204 start_codon:yes stop_codon:yes gene_type:complete
MMLIETLPTGESTVAPEIAEEIQLLQERHKDLKLDLMEADFQYDEILAQRIKKEKLRLKDQIQHLSK